EQRRAAGVPRRAPALEGIAADRALEREDPGARRQHERERRPSVRRAPRSPGLLLVLALAGCAALHHGARPVVQGVSAEQLLGSLASRRQAIPSLRPPAPLNAAPAR